MTKLPDINCDMGEGMSTDASIMPYITSASIACGYHAGDEATIRQILQLASQHRVKAGAHISFADRENFGRKELQLSDAQLRSLVHDQLKLFLSVCNETGTTCHHVKPHGALYNLSACDANTARVIADAVKDIDSSLVLYGLSGSYSITEAEKLGLSAAPEAFADRSYQDDGSLTPRSRPGAVHADVETVISQVRQLIESNTVTCLSGKTIPVRADTICIHGDGEHAVEFARAIFHTFNLQAHR